ncbi:MAG TPA: sigma 54-interacting transcriptional regulator [Myxococcota bacterium]|nr:sigma 54-interacting transcriptional regulator [Myxococcota bacterium]
MSTLLERLEALGRSDHPPPDITALIRLARRESETRADMSALVKRYQRVLERVLDLTSASGLEPVAAKVIDGMLEVAGARRGFVGLTLPEGGWRVLVARNMARGDIPDPNGVVSSSIIGEVLRTGDEVIANDASREAGRGASVMAMRLRSVACLPLVSGGRPFGFVYLDDPGSEGLFDDAALTAVRAWLPVAADSVQRAFHADASGPLGVPTRSQALTAELERLARVARFDASILLTGETGTGKTMLARRLHDASARADGPFVHISCGAIPETLLEAELFGAEAGAYTGLKAARPGRFEIAAKGTLFLDELDTMPVTCQVKLLVALQERTITRLGSNAEIPVDVRIIAAMSSDPRRAIADGRLREDLYYRLAVIELRVPALRERREDIPLLVHRLLESTSRRYGMPPLRMTAAALAQLEARDWPGNLRELQNVIDRAALYSEDGLITSVDGRPPQAAQTGVAAALRAAAASWIEALPTHPALRGIELASAFRGYVISEAIATFGDRDAAMVALGEEELLENRNHHRLIRRELERQAQLEAALAER